MSRVVRVAVVSLCLLTDFTVLTRDAPAMVRRTIGAALLAGGVSGRFDSGPVLGAGVLAPVDVIGMSLSTSSDANSIRFFSVNAKDGPPPVRAAMIADEENAQNFLFERTGLMFRVNSYEPIPFQLAETTDEAAAMGRFLTPQVDAELARAGYGDPADKNLVFYGGTGFSGGSALLGGRTGVLWFANGGKYVAAVHELFHTFGLVPTCAPHEQGAHVLDDTDDLMRSQDDPQAIGSSGAGIQIDANHDDYFDPTGRAISGCPASLNLANSPWVTPGVFRTLHIETAGNGFVQVGGVGICAATCDLPKAVGTTYLLVPQPDDHWRFTGWAGACSGAGECSVTMDDAKSVRATFVADLAKVTVRIIGRGRVDGLVRGGCSHTCSRAVPAGATVSLSAVPARGWRFAHWMGCGSRCIFHAARKTVTARFVATP